MRIERLNDEIRKIKITRNYIIYPEGSVLIEFGNTKIICNATVEENIPNFLKNTASGWVTAEYSMLPRATTTRNYRDINKLKQNSRSVEIQRLIGRALRGCIDLDKLGERSVFIDCDVIQADGGTRCASITGGFIALYDAMESLISKNIIYENPITNFIAAVSVGKIENKIYLDLCYEEDFKAEVDMNFVMNDKEEFIEIQGTAENGVFSKNDLYKMTDYATKGINNIILEQKKSLGLL